jgi:hypothetical protein
LSCSQRQLQVGSLSTAFLTSLALTSFLLEAKQTFTRFSNTHHTLGSSRATTSRLGGFTSKSNKCHKDYFTNLKCSSTRKEDSLNPLLRISHKSQDPHKEGLGRAHKGLGWVYFVGGPSNLQRREGKAFILVPQKLVVGNYPVKIRTSSFENWNIRYLKTSRWSSSAQTGPSGLGNQIIRFYLVQ